MDINTESQKVIEKLNENNKFNFQLKSGNIFVDSEKKIIVCLAQDKFSFLRQHSERVGCLESQGWNCVAFNFEEFTESNFKKIRHKIR